MAIRRGLATAALAAAAFLTLSAVPGSAQEAPPADAAPKEPKTEAVTKGAFTVTLDLNGTFDARRTWEVLFDAEHWGGELEVVEMAMPGPVEKGAVLAKFKTDKVDEALAAAERDVAQARIAFQRQVDEQKRVEESQALAFRRTEVEAQTADLALRRFVEWEKELRLKEADQRLQQTKDNFADQEEELRQLEKMYKADELTEETEEIVLKRSQRQLERAKFWMASQLRRDEVWRSQDIPREEDNLKANQRRTALDLDRARMAQQGAAEWARVDFERAKTAVEKQEENLAKLKRDRAKFTLVAPESGYAVYGQLTKGKWAWTDVPPQALIAQDRFKTKVNQVLFTIVRPGEVTVRTSVGEASAYSVTEGQSAKVKPGPAPKTSLAAKVARVARTSGGTDYEVALEVEQPDPRLMPGQTCKITLTTLEKADALTVPAAAVESDGDKRYLHVWADGKATRKEVETGETSGGRTEITSGAAEGDRVLATAPKAK